MNQTLDELYLTWLYGQIGSVKLRDRSRTYWSLARQLYTKEFVWIVPNDDNRVEDGKALRGEFVEEHDLEILDSAWMGLGCSVLEMLIAFSRACAFQDDGEPRTWFWLMVENIDLKQFSDNNYGGQSIKEIDDILDRVIWRTFQFSGEGGLFPLDHPDRDQRKVEIWYQFSAYFIEKDYLK
jgi:hypothetical protein